MEISYHEQKENQLLGSSQTQAWCPAKKGMMESKQH